MEWSRVKWVSCIGECLIELSGTPFTEAIRQTFGGDTLNTAVYLSRLAPSGVAVKYLTAVGTDDLSEGLLRSWRAEGIDTSAVLRDSARLPGLYWIQVDERGERSFLYWRTDSAARYMMRHHDFKHVASALADCEIVYLSGISLAILPSEDREKLLALLRRLAAHGTAIVLDTNYRPSLWPSIETAQAALDQILPYTELVFATLDDHRSLYRDNTPEVARTRLHSAGANTVVIKLGAAGCLFSDGAETFSVAAVPTSSVVDTTAAGDAFNAAFMAARMAGRDPAKCCISANALAGMVIQHRGAVIPACATPPLSTLLASESCASAKHR